MELVYFWAVRWLSQGKSEAPSAGNTAEGLGIVQFSGVNWKILQRWTKIVEKIDDFEMVFVMNSSGSEHVLASEWQDQVSGIKGVDTG